MSKAWSRLIARSYPHDALGHAVPRSLVSSVRLIRAMPRVWGAELRTAMGAAMYLGSGARLRVRPADGGNRRDGQLNGGGRHPRGASTG